MNYGAQTEYEKLTKVLMHRPGVGLKRIKPGNKDAYLFRDIAYWKEFQREHDVFRDVLIEEGIDVILINDILDAKDAKIASTLPNLVYTRDVSTVTNNGAISLRMTHQPRYPEPFIIEKVWKKLDIPLYHKITSPGLVEGGDFVWLDEDVLMIGYGTRSNETGINSIRRKMLGDIIEEFVAVPLPNFRVHLDGALMIMSPNLAIFHKGSLGLFPVFRYTSNDVELIYLEDYLKMKGFELILADNSEVRMFGTNILGLGEMKCVTYEWNERIMKILEKRGFDVIGIPGNQLSIGGGGPHCMTCPIHRER